MSQSEAKESGAVVPIRLKRGREKPLEQGHPWLFSGAIAEELLGEADEAAALARVESSEGKNLGMGFYSPRSQIRVRMLRRDEGPIDRAFFIRRLEAARALRERLIPAKTTGYRLVNAEGDGLPGWTVDRYDRVLVSQITVAGLERLRGEAYGALAELYPEAAILQANRGAPRRREGLGQGDETIAGEVPAELEFRESGLRFLAELEGGQKTGFYLDQRPNRRKVEELATDRRVLDLFAHSGAFSAYALRGGAKEVVAVESAERLIELGRRQIELNRLPGERLEWVRGNAFNELRERDDRFDLVICDPPPLVKRKSDLKAGARAYQDLNRSAFRRLAPGGLLLTFSCSAAVDAKLFRQLLFSAAVEAERRVVLLAPLGPGADHPVAITHPEGEYLKGWLAAVVED